MERKKVWSFGFGRKGREREREKEKDETLECLFWKVCRCSGAKMCEEAPSILLQQSFSGVFCTVVEVAVALNLPLARCQKTVLPPTPISWNRLIGRGEWHREARPKQHVNFFILVCAASVSFSTDIPFH